MKKYINLMKKTLKRNSSVIASKDLQEAQKQYEHDTSSLQEALDESASVLWDTAQEVTKLKGIITNLAHGGCSHDQLEELKKRFPLPEKPQHPREWWVVSSILHQSWLLVVCKRTGQTGTVRDPSLEEWGESYDAYSKPYRWTDESRVHIDPQPQEVELVAELSTTD